MIEIRELQESDLGIWKALRFQALADAPYAFGDTLDEARRRSDQEWRASLWDGDGKLFIARFDAVAVGMVRVRRDSKDSKSCGLYSMWVAPTVRSKGVGKALMLAALRWAEQVGVGEMFLMVADGNESAKRLYLAAGFTVTGDVRPLRSNPTVMMHRMVKPVDQ